MSASVQIGLLLALATAFGSVLGFLYKHRGAVESPEVSMSRPVRSSLALFRSRWYVLGIAIALCSWGLHVGALALAPISLVQSVIAGGLVLLTVTADRLFAHRVTRREWIGVALAALGLAFLAATLEGAGDSPHSSYDPATLALWVSTLAVLGLGVAFAARQSPRAGVLYAASAGLLWAASDSSIKALSNELGDASALSILSDPLALVIALASFAGLVISARSLQIGKAVPVIAVTSVAANVFTIAAGPIVFSEPVPEEPFAFTARILAFALVVFAAALTPAPVHVVEAEATG